MKIEEWIMINGKTYSMSSLEVILFYLEKEPDALGRAVEGIINNNDKGNS